MILIVVSGIYLTKSYDFLDDVNTLDAEYYEGGFLISLSGSGTPLLMHVDSTGNVLEVSVLPSGTDKIRLMKRASDGQIWGVSGTEVLRIVWPDSVEGVNFISDSVVGLYPLFGDTALVVAIQNMPRTYKFALVASGTVLVSNEIVGLNPSAGFVYADVEPMPSGFAVALMEDSRTLHVGVISGDLTSFSWTRKINLPSSSSFDLGGVHLGVFPDGKIVVAYTVNISGYTYWAYSLFASYGSHIRTVKLYPLISHHYVRGVKVVSDTTFILYGAVSDASTNGAVVVLDTSGTVLHQYKLTSVRGISYTELTPGGYVMVGDWTSDSVVGFLKQLPSFGPCDTSGISVTVDSIPVDIEGSSLYLAPSYDSLITLSYPLTPSLSPTVTTTCSTSIFIPDTVSPTVIGTYPPNGATGVPITETVRVYFSEPINTATFNSSTVSVSLVGSYSTSCITPDTCIITHTPFPPGTTITVHLSDGITDMAGNNLVPYTFSFQTLPATVGTLSIVLTSPDSGEINVPLNANVGVWFSDDVNSSTVNGGSVRIHGWDGSTVRSYSFSVTCPTNLFCVLDPSPLFRPSEVVTVEFTDSIKSLSGGIPLTPKVITFRTQDVDTLRPVVVFTIPDSGATGVPTNANVGVQFSRDMDTATLSGNVVITGSISGTHGYFFHCPAMDYCTLDPYPDFTAGEEVSIDFTDGILDTDGRRLVPKTVTFIVGSGQDNTPPTVYIISSPNDTITLYNAGELIRAYVSDPGGIQRVDWVLLDQTYSKPTDCSGSLYTDPDTSCLTMPSVPSGVYLLKAFAYDRSNNVGYDSVWVAFNDTVPPRLILTEPSDGDVGVSPHTDIRLVFSEDMDTSFFGSLVVRVGSTTYTYTHLWESMDILRVSPSTPFPYDSVVRVRVDSFTDLSGNPMVPDSFSFRIISNASVSSTIVTVSPDTVYVGSGDSVEVVGVIFSTYPITGADVILDGDSAIGMVANDGVYDEVEETVAVKIYTEKEGTHTVVVRGYNAYDYGTSPTANFYVLKVPFLSKDNVVVYPNPAKGRAKVRFVLGDDAYATVEVFDLKAKKVFSTSRMFEGFKTHVIDLPNLPPGLYLLRIRARDQKVERWFSILR